MSHFPIIDNNMLQMTADEICTKNVQCSGALHVFAPCVLRTDSYSFCIFIDLCEVKVQMGCSHVCIIVTIVSVIHGRRNRGGPRGAGPPNIHLRPCHGQSSLSRQRVSVVLSRCVLQIPGIVDQRPLFNLRTQLFLISK